MAITIAEILHDYDEQQYNLSETLCNAVGLNQEYLGMKRGLSEERLSAQIESLRQLIAFYREYPDLLIDKMTGYTPEGFQHGEYHGFRFYTYQRIFLRAVMRHRYVYATFPRAYSKSFLSMMALMLRCILFPGSELFITTGGKEQAASITIAKIEEICRLIPALNNEINWEKGISKKSKNDVKYIFKNGSKIDILAARESSRGQRRTGRKIFIRRWSYYLILKPQY